MPPARDLLLQAARHGSEICHAEWCVRFQDVHPVVRDAVGLLGRDLGGAHIQTLVDLHGVRADYFAPELFGQRYAQAVLPVAGPTTATTGCLYDASKLLFQLLSGQLEHAGAAVRAERRHFAGNDLFGQRQQLLRGGLVPRLDGRTAGDGMQHPLGARSVRRGRP